MVAFIRPRSRVLFHGGDYQLQKQMATPYLNGLPFGFNEFVLVDAPTLALIVISLFNGFH